MRFHKRLLAGILAFSFSVAQAGPADLVLTPFTGDGIVATDLQSVGFQELPWTDAFGRLYSGPADQNINSFGGLNLGNGSWTISDLGPGVNKVGWYWVRFFDAEMTNVSFSNGDSYSVVTPLPDATPTWFGLQSNTPFTSVTITFGGNGSGGMTDFITQAVVPEPTTIVSSVICALCVGVVAYRKHRGRRLASV